MNRHDRLTYFPLVVAVAFSLFAGSEIYQRAAIELTGMVVDSETSCRQPANNRCATVYVVSAAGGARSTYIAGPVDHALARRLPVGTVIRKLKWSLSYVVDGRPINDFPIGFYLGVIGAALVLAAWSLWRIGRRRLSAGLRQNGSRGRSPGTR